MTPLTLDDLLWLKREVYIEPEGAPPPEAKRASRCICDSPHSYRDEDGDVRCHRCARYV